MRGSLYNFNPRNTGLYEARVWKAYYERHWPLALFLVFRLLRSQFNLSPLPAARATYYSVRAALAWAPRVNDPERVQALLTRFYTVLRDATGGRFDPAAAGAAECAHWAVHRRLDGQTDQLELREALARVAAAVYNLPVPGRVRPGPRGRRPATSSMRSLRDTRRRRARLRTGPAASGVRPRHGRAGTLIPGSASQWGRPPSVHYGTLA